MKLYCGLLLALVAIDQTAAFAPAAFERRSLALHSEMPGAGVGAGVDSMTGGPGGQLGAPGGPDMNPAAPGGALAADMQFAGAIDAMDRTRIQGGQLKTWSFKSPDVQRMMVMMTSDDETLDSLVNEGRLLNVKLDLCEGPDNTPFSMEVYSGKGKLRPFKAVIESPGAHSSLFLRNLGTIEFPIQASVAPCNEDGIGEAGMVPISSSLYDMNIEKTLQGGSVYTYPLEPSVSSAKVYVTTDGRPLNCKIELIQGPNAVKITMDLYTEDGMERPFYTVITTPGSANVVRIVNTASFEFPLQVVVEPFSVEE